VKFEVAVIPAKAGIQRLRQIRFWTPACAGVTFSNIFGPYQLFNYQVDTGTP
jgi:hypothetical protein